MAIDDATPEMVHRYIKDHELGIPVGSAPRDQATRYPGIAEVERLMVPKVIVIDRHGVVQAQGDVQGTPELQNEAYLRELIGKLLRQ